MSQTSGYDFALAKAQAGQKYDLRPDRVESFAAEGAIEFGRPVVAGTDAEKQVKVCDGAGQVFRGIALFTHAREQGLDRTASPASTEAQYEDQDTVSVLRQGMAWVTAGADGVAADETAYIDVDNSTYDYTNAAGADNIAAGTFRTGGDTGDLVLVEVNLP